LASSVPIESVAQAIHERWRQEAIANGDEAPAWRELDESRKASSRDQARHIPAHLRAIGCVIEPLTDRQATAFSFTDSEVKALAVAEHDRWNRERAADGWTLAPEKNVARKQTPYLLPWEQLNERYPNIAAMDAVFVRALPAILAAAGLQIVRAPAG
jgi:RyR domain-containing protein